ncbi:hypothetical protein VPHK479_0003 [Vibrio phage K479]
MPRKQSTSRKTGTVQKFVGTAYDEMKALYDNLDSLLALQSGVEYTLRYLGPSAGDAPATREDGSPIQDGDYFFDTDSDALVYYDASDDIWFAVDPSEVIQARDEAISAQIVAVQAKDNAELAADNARLSENTARVYEASAEASKDAAALSELSAGLSATDAATYAAQTAIDASNTAADVQTTNADVVSTTDNAADAATHAVNAQNSETAAALSAQQAEQAFDSFDDRYLGTFASHPTTDNDGDPLKTGATYYSSTDLAVYYWNGAVWESPDKSATDSANAAAASATTATTKAGEAANSATSALTSKTNAAASESAALASKNAAELAEVNAELSENNAAISEANAGASELVAKASENAAGVSASSAKDDADRAEQFAAGGTGLTKVAHEVARELRKREYAGSGFAEWGKHIDTSSEDPINQGMYSAHVLSNQLRMGRGSSDNGIGESRTDVPIAIVDGVEHTIDEGFSHKITTIDFPTAPDGAKSLNASTGEVHKYHDLAGVGEAYETYSVDFDGSTYIDLTAVPYSMGVGSKVELKFKWNGDDSGSGASQTLLVDTTASAYLTMSIPSNPVLFYAGWSSVTVNGESVSSGTFAFEPNVEYHIVGIASVATSFTRIGTNSTLVNFVHGEIWDIKLEDPTLTTLGIPPRHYLNADWQSADDAAPDYTVVTDRNGYTSEDWTPDFNTIATCILLDNAWVAKVGDEVSFVWTPEDVSTQFALGNSESNAVWFGITGSVFYWGDSSRWEVYINGVLTTYSTYVATANETHHIRMLRTNVDASIGFDSIGRDTSSSTSSATGTIRDVRLTDNTNPENSRHYPLVINSATKPDTLVAEDVEYDKDTAPFYTPDYNATSDARAAIPTWSATDTNNELLFKVRLDDINGEQMFITSDSNDSNVIFYIGKRSHTHSNANTLFWIGVDGNASVDGVEYPNNMFVMETGVEYTVSCPVLAPREISSLGRLGYTGTGYDLKGALWDVSFTDNTDPTNSRYYPSLEYRVDGDTSGTVLEEVLKPELLENHDFSDGDDGTWSKTNDGIGGSSVVINSGNAVMTVGSSGNGLFPEINQRQSTEAQDYTIVIDIDNPDGVEFRIRGFANGDIATRGTGELTFTEPAISNANRLLQFFIQGSASDTGKAVTINSLSVKKVTDGQLVNFPAGSEWTKAQVDGASDGTLENFTVGSEWDNDLVTDGTIVGTTLRAPMTLQDAQKCFLEAKYTDFEPIISRKDLVFLETWREKVVGFVRPFGNVQFGDSSHDGVSLVPVTNFVDQGYSAFGEWDINTIGEVADWDGMSAEQRAAWTGNPKNNLFFDAEDNEFYQECYRIRVVEGLGDDWQRAGMKFNNNYDRLGYRTNDLVVCPQGESTEIVADLRHINHGSYVPKNNTSYSAVGDYGYFQRAFGGGGLTQGGALPIALVQRLNQGGYHPTWNSAGCAMFDTPDAGRTRPWYNLHADQTAPTSVEDCFAINGDTSPLGGSIAQGTSSAGRSDQYQYFDAIYAGQVEDLRLNANKQDYARLLTDSARSGFAGETRGKGKVPFTKFYTADQTATGSSTGSFDNILPTGSAVQVGDVCSLENAAGTYETVTITALFSSGRSISFEPSITGRKADSKGMFTEYMDSTAEYDSLPWVDIVGDPERIAATFPDGVVGQWIPQIPTGSTLFLELNKKCNQSTMPIVATTNDGVTWGSATVSVDTVQNGRSATPSANGVELYFYEALSGFTEPDNNRAVQGDLGDVFVSNQADNYNGNRLMPSLINEIGKSQGYPQVSNVPVIDYILRSEGTLHNASANAPKHEPHRLPATQNDSDAVKTLPHLVEKDGLLYVQHHATQLVYQDTINAVTAIPSVQFVAVAGDLVILSGWDNQSMNGKVLKCTADISPTWAANYFDNWTITSDGYLKRYTDDVVHAQLKEYQISSDRWGDDSEITIVDDESTKTDQNGNTVKVVTHTHMIPIGIANKNQTK